MPVIIIGVENFVSVVQPNEPFSSFNAGFGRIDQQQILPGTLRAQMLADLSRRHAFIGVHGRGGRL